MRNLLVVFAWLAASRSLAAQITDMERQLGEQMLGGVFWALDSLYFDASYKEPQFAEHWWPARQTVRQANSWGEILGAIANALHGMRDSHTRFIPPGLTVAVNYGWRWQVIGDACYVAAVERGSDAARRGLRVGDRVVAIDGREPTPANLDVIRYVYHELAPRERMEVVVERGGGVRDTVVFEAKLRRRPPVSDVSDLETRRRILYEASLADPGLRHRFKAVDSVAVWGFNRFEEGDGRIDRHMRDARRRPWLVLDLRGNPGGVLETAGRLLGHFADTAYVAYRQVWRDSTTEFTVTPRRDTPYAGRVVVLLDRESASSAEITAWLLRERHGAVLLGDRSPGEVRGSYVIPLMAGGGSDGRYYTYGVQVTVFDIVLPGEVRLEGPGVTPDTLILPDGDDVAAGHDPVLARALALAGVRMTPEEAGRFWR